MAHLMQRQNRLDRAIYWYIRASQLDPEDPELPMQIASWLYDLGLPESADAWATRAIAIAPHAPPAKVLMMEQAIQGGDDVVIEAVARQIISETTEDRLWVVRTAAAELCRIHLEHGTPRQAVDFLLDRYPEAADSSNVRLGAAPFFAQIMVQMTRVMSEPELDRAAIAKQYQDKLVALDPELTDDPVFHTWAYLLAGDLEAAAKAAAEGRLSEPWAMNSFVLRMYNRPWYRQLQEFPEVREKLADLQSQRRMQREATVAMLAQEGLGS
jgi:hypothetical protein